MYKRNEFYSQFCVPDEARDGQNVALIDKCFMVCSIMQRRIKLISLKLAVDAIGNVSHVSCIKASSV